MSIKKRFLLGLTAAIMGIATLAGSAFAGNAEEIRGPEAPNTGGVEHLVGDPKLVDYVQDAIDQSIRDAVRRANEAKARAEQEADDAEPPPTPEVCAKPGITIAPERICIPRLDGGLPVPGEIEVGPVRNCAGMINGGLPVPGEIEVGPVRDCVNGVIEAVPSPVGLPRLPDTCAVLETACTDRGGL